MSIFITIINIIVGIAAVLLILLVVAQSNRGSDLGLFGGSAEMVFGSQQLNALSKITIILATIVLGGVFLAGAVKVLSLKKDSASFAPKKEGVSIQSLTDKKSSNTKSSKK